MTITAKQYPIHYQYYHGWLLRIGWFVGLGNFTKYEVKQNSAWLVPRLGVAMRFELRTRQTGTLVDSFHSELAATLACRRHDNECSVVDNDRAIGEQHIYRNFRTRWFVPPLMADLET